MTFGDSQGFMKGVTSPDDEARAVLDRALAFGIDFIDTANMYSEGRSETLLGQWLGPKRKSVILATKVRFPMGPGVMDQGLSRRHIIQACEDSLVRLNTDWIDLYQVHMQDGSVPIDETLRALDDLVRWGKVRYIGCSNYAGYRLVESVGAAEKLHTARYESVQLQWHLLERGAEREVIPACRAFDLGVMVWSPLARGLLSGKYHQGQPPPSGARLEAWKDSWARADERTWKVLDALRAVSQEVGASPAQVAIAWLLSKAEVTSVIVGARTVKQLEENLGAATLKVPPAQLAALDRASEPQWGYPYDFIAMRERW